MKRDNIVDDTMSEETVPASAAAAENPVRKKRFTTVRAALVCLLIFTLICGIIYPGSVTFAAQTLFPYEANGSQIIVTLSDGTTRIYGSELIGQNYESAEYLFGRVNTGAPTNLSPESDEFNALVKENVAARKEKLAKVGYEDLSAVPSELVTSSGSGVDPHISPDAAYFQVGAIVAGRKTAGWKLLTDADGNITVLSPEDAAIYQAGDGESISDYTEDYVRGVIEKYTEGRFLWIFGEKRVNVLLVNLALDGLM